MPMNREDFERMGPPQKPVRRDYIMESVEVRVIEIGLTRPGHTEGPLEHVSIIMEARDGRTCLLPVTREECDIMIRALIAGRNHLWPTP